MKLKIAVLTVAAAALGASGALAAKPAHPTHPTTPASTNAAKPTVMVVIHGTITAYTAASGTTNGSVTVNVTGSNHFAKTLRGSFTFVVSSSSTIVGTPTVNHNATLKWRAAKAPTTSAPSGAIKQLIDQGAAA
jgi:hypothetical protein